MNIKIIFTVLIIALVGLFGTIAYNHVFEAGADSVRAELKKEYDGQVLVESNNFKVKFADYTEATTLAQTRLNEYWSERLEFEGVNSKSAAVTHDKVERIKHEIIPRNDNCIVAVGDIGLLKRSVAIIERPQGFVSRDTTSDKTVTSNRYNTNDTLLRRFDASAPEYW